MTDRNQDLQAWLEPYRETFASFVKAQQEGFRTLERFARFHYAVAGDLFEAGLAQTRTAFSARTAVGTQVIADLLQKQAELGTQLSEKLKARAQEFSTLAGEVHESMDSLMADATRRATEAAGRATGAKKVA